ncbi:MULTISPECIES: ornithine cyclodeaminase [Gemella]|uniref:ornithine cyclodeaminase n=1 Tax=Gemella TaxID=1378 RepID=UPI0007684D50|nr:MULTISPECIES: ornithine cyclodeaminase [Gemella]AME09719.1 ornithine cyclodeaminase [Gemella sp. oral taxon 928]AXI27321.1 ornithine cyclodeaminase family protein [Gemella sp. ND 6198]
MIILTKEDIKKCITMKEAIEISKEALKNYSNKNAIVPLRTNLNIDKYNGQALFMPACISGENDSLGIKIVSVYPDNVKNNLPSVPATMLVFNSKTGIISGLLDGTYLTQLRTAALQGAATDLLAKKNSRIAVLIGTGGQAYEQAHAMLTIRKLDELRVVGRNFEKTKKFVELINNDFKHFNTKIIALENSNTAIIDADIITTVTTSTTPTFNSDFIKLGTHINGIGSYTPEMIELPPKITTRADKIFFDTNNGVLSEAGDILLALKEKMINKSSFTGELGELISKKVSGRENNDEITLFKSVGSAVLDVATSEAIIKKATKIGIGNYIKI